MHFEILVEDVSGMKLLEAVLPNILTGRYSGHTWRIISCKGVGRIPPDLGKKPDAANRALLSNLPRLLKGYGQTYPEGACETAVVVVLDCDRNNCRSLLDSMRAILKECSPQPLALFRIAIEEIEAWLLGDKCAIQSAYPKANSNILKRYSQDSICGTWEHLADAIYQGGSAVLLKKPFFEIGKTKSEWAEKIGPRINIEENKSYSFCKFRDGLRRLAASQSEKKDK